MLIFGFNPVNLWYRRWSDQKLAIAVVMTFMVSVVSSINGDLKQNENIIRMGKFGDMEGQPCCIANFACGKMLEPKPINLTGLGRSLLLDDYKEPIKDDEHKIVKAAKGLFQTCIKNTTIGKDDIEKIKEVLKSAGGFPELEGKAWDESNFDWLQATYKLKELGYDYTTFLDVTVITYPEDIETRVLQVSLPGLLSSPDTFYDSYTFNISKRYAYAKKIGVNIVDPNVRKNLDEAFDLQRELFNTNFQDYPGETNGISFEKFTVEDYQVKASCIDWLEIISTMVGPQVTISKYEFVFFPPPETACNRLKLILQKSKRVLANLMMWRVMRGLIPYRDYLHFAKNVSEGYDENFCLKLTQDRFHPDPVEIMLAKKYPLVEKRDALYELLDSMRKELYELLQNSTWIEHSEKLAVLKAINDLKLIIGYPSDYWDDRHSKIFENTFVDMIEDKKATFFPLLAQANRYQKSAMFNKLKKIHRVYMDYPLTSDFPTYYGFPNAFWVPMALFNSSEFDENLPRYVNYGRIGSLIGYYLVDILTSRVNGRDNSLTYIDDWSTKTRKKFKNNVSCLEQPVTENDEYNREGMLMTHIALSQRAAYAAYVQWTEDRKVSELKLTLHNKEYTPRQAFWISAASTFCNPTIFYGYDNTFTNPLMGSHILTTIMGLNEDFLRDFNCPERLKSQRLKYACPFL